MLKKQIATTGIITLAALSIAVVRPAMAQTAIIENKTSKATIYHDAGEGNPVELAAKELQSHLQQMTGVTVPISTDASKLKGYVIYLGDTAFARKNGIQTKTLPHDGYRILSNKQWMIIAGRDYSGPPLTGFDNPFRINETFNTKLGIGVFGDAGTLSGVYQFLERYGVRWYMPGKLGTVVPRTSKVVVPALNLTKSPFYEYRYAYYAFPDRSDDQTLWYRRSGYGAPVPVQIQHSFGRWFHKYKDTHPEYFALIGGKRDYTTLSTILGPGGYNLTDKGLIQRAVDTAIQYFDENPGQMLFPLAPEDGMQLISEDPESQSYLDPNDPHDGKFSNYVWTFVNKVAIEVAKKYPDKYIGCFAYERYSLPPSRIEKLSPNVAVMITKFRAMYPDPQRKANTEKKIIAWSRKAATIYTWEYYCNPLFNPGWQGYPMFFTKILQDDLKFQKGISKGEFIEAESWLPEQYSTAPEKILMSYPGLDHLLLYINARLLWNPDLDLQALLSEYYKKFYGPAEAPMRGFWQLIEANWMKKGWQNSPTEVYDPATVNKLIDFIKDAQSKTAPGSDYRARVDLISSEFQPGAEIAQRLAKLSATSAEVTRLSNQIGTPGSRMDLGSAPVQQLLDRSFLPATPATNARFGWDQRNLYVEMSLHEPAMNKLQALAKERDSGAPAIWEDDAVEIFISPDAANPHKAFQYIINSNGTLFDGKYAGKDSMLNRDWNGDARVVVKKEAARWIVQLSVPWTELGVKPAPGLKLKANFYRNRRAGGAVEQSSWAPLVEGNFYSPERFGTLTLGETVAPAVATLPAIIRPATSADYGSGPTLKGYYNDGGHPNVGVFAGHPNTLARGDRVLARFDLRPLLENADKVQKVELLTYIDYVVGALYTRELEIDHFNSALPVLSNEGISSLLVESAGRVMASKKTTVPATLAAKTAPVPLRIDVTNLVKADLASGHVSTTFRWRDVLAEKEGNPNIQPVGVNLSTGAETVPALAITYSN